MKKIIILPFLLICLLLATSQSAVAAQAHARLIIPGYGDVAAPGFDDLAQFSAYLQTADLPEGFVMPDELAAIGAFHSWLDLTERKQPANTEYYYGLELPEDDVVLWLHVQHGAQHDESHLQELDPSYVGDSMTNLSDTAVAAGITSGVIHRGGLTYHYNSGKLYRIIWQTEYAALVIEPALTYGDEISCNPGSFMEKLLSLDEGKFNEAQNVLLALGTNDQPADVPQSGDHVIVFAGLLGLSALAVTVLHRKRKLF